MRRVRVDVMAEDIARGTRNNCFCCPIALALRRVTGMSVDASGDYISWGLETALTPRKAAKFMKAYDAGDAVQPLSFTLRAIE